jgi:ATP-dependent protease HslVU (ClpYQ) ATPase subunit
MNEELAIRSKEKSWWQPWQFFEQVGNDDAEFIAAISPEIVLELLHEIERRFAIQAELNALRTRTNQLISESNKYCAEVSRGKSATIRMGIELDDAKESISALTLAIEVERDAANLYARQVAHWIEKHDALLAQQLQTEPQEWNDKNVIAWCVARGIMSAK